MIYEDVAKKFLKYGHGLADFLKDYAYWTSRNPLAINPVSQLNDQEIVELVDLWKKAKQQRLYVLAATRCAGLIPTKQYISDVCIQGRYDNPQFNFSYVDNKDDALRWDKRKLNWLSLYFPKEAIEAMKEPVESD